MVDINFALLPESYASLSAENVQRNAQLLCDLWKSAEPEIDMEHGSLLSLVVRPSATLLEAGKEAFYTARKSSSFAALLSDTSGINGEMLNELARSYRIQRKPGVPASGIMRIFFDADSPRSIGFTAAFEANGILFRVTGVETIQGTTSPPSTLPHYQNLRKTNDGSEFYYADIEVIAQTPGSAGNLVRGTELILQEMSISYFSHAVALETFYGGEDEEPDHELIQRMLLGVSAKVLSSRVNMQASLLENFPHIRGSSIIGTGDEEMTRDKHTAFPGSVGGYVDWYVGTTRQLQTTSVVVEEESLLSLGLQSDSRYHYWVSLYGSQIDCLYYVTGIQDEETAEFCEILSKQSAMIDATIKDPAAPKIHTAEEAAFSAYQLREIKFASKLPVKKIRVRGFYAPGIAEIQQWVNHHSQAPVGLDVLVKGAIPTTIKFSAIIHLPPGIAEDDVTLKNAIASHINRVPFGGLLAVSGLLAVLHNHLPSGSYVSNPALFATTYLPDGTIANSQTADRLIINFPPYATNNTTLFFCDPAEVSFSYRVI